MNRRLTLMLMAAGLFGAAAQAAPPVLSGAARSNDPATKPLVAPLEPRNSTRAGPSSKAVITTAPYTTSPLSSSNPAVA